MPAHCASETLGPLGLNCALAAPFVVAAHALNVGGGFDGGHQHREALRHRLALHLRRGLQVQRLSNIEHVKEKGQQQTKAHNLKMTRQFEAARSLQPNNYTILTEHQERLPPLSAAFAAAAGVSTPLKSGQNQYTPLLLSLSLPTGAVPGRPLRSRLATVTWSEVTREKQRSWSTCFALWPLTKPAVFFPMSMNITSGMGSSRRPFTGRPPDQYSTFLRKLKWIWTAGPVAPCWIKFTPLASTFLQRPCAQSLRVSEKESF
jgi:hypothetical protein